MRIYSICLLSLAFYALFFHILVYCLATFVNSGSVLLGCIGSKYLTDIAYNFHWLIYRK